MDKKQENRQLIENKALELCNNNQGLILEFATGVGKTKIALKCAVSHLKEGKILILVSETLHIENWIEELKKWQPKEFLEGKFEIACHASIHNYKDQEFDAIIVDEAHHLSINRTTSLLSNKANKWLFLSATLDRYVKERIQSIIKSEIYTITLDEAIEMSIIPEPSIYLVPVELDDVHKKHPTKFGKSIFKLSDRGKANWFDKQIKYWQEKYDKAEEANLLVDVGLEKNNEWMKTKYIRLGGDRKKFLAECKTYKAKQFIKKLSEFKTIWFCGSIDQASELSPLNSIHSRKSKKINTEIVEAFSEGKIKHIFVNNMGREGLNLPDIECGVIIQLDSGSDEGLTFIQKNGRVFRASSPIIYILYCKQTQDERYLKRALEHIDNQYIKEYKS